MKADVQAKKDTVEERQRKREQGEGRKREQACTLIAWGAGGEKGSEREISGLQREELRAIFDNRGPEM